MKLQISDCTRQGTFEVHIDGCADVAKLARRGLRAHAEEHASQLSVSASIRADFISEGSMTAEEGLGEIEFKPCCKALPYK